MLFSSWHINYLAISSHVKYKTSHSHSHEFSTKEHPWGTGRACFHLDLEHHTVAFSELPQFLGQRPPHLDRTASSARLPAGNNKKNVVPAKFLTSQKQGFSDLRNQKPDPNPTGLSPVDHHQPSQVSASAQAPCVRACDKAESSRGWEMAGEDFRTTLPFICDSLPWKMAIFHVKLPEGNPQFFWPRDSPHKLSGYMSPATWVET